MDHSDFVVVGGGVYGAAIAYELAQRGASVTVVEAGALAQGASGGPGKRGVRANARNSRELPLIREALELWPTLAETLGSETGFERLGGISLISTMPETGEIGLAQAVAHRDLQLHHGIATELVDRERLATLEPGLSSSLVAALYCPDEGMADQRATALAYAAAARARGVVVREDARAVQIGGAPRPFVRLSDGSTVTARRTVVLTANQGTNALLERSTLGPLPLWTMVPQVLMLRARLGYQPQHLVGHLHQKLSVKPLCDGTIMVSGGLRGRWNSRTGRGTPVDAMVQQSLNTAEAVFPPLQGGELVLADASVPETYTPDGLPYIDFLTDTGDVFVATGWHGHGFAIAPAMSKHIADWLTSGKRPAVLAPFTVPPAGSRVG